MGYEFQIRVSLTTDEKEELTDIIKKKSSYSSDSTTQSKRSFEFKDSETQSEMPNFTVEFEDYGIYVCQNISSEVWANLKDVKDWLLKHKKHFEVEEL